MPRCLALCLALLCLTLLCLAPSVLAQDAPGQPTEGQAAERPRNLILLIPDGLGPASVTMARTFSGRPLALDGVLRGAVRTASTSSDITDSAASATAYASGIATYNGAVGVDTLGRPVGTILEAAETRGLATGLVVTSRVTHATPASFAAHVPERWAEEAIAAQMMEAGLEVLFGGGRRFFLPKPDDPAPGGERGGARTDGRDLLAEARARGVAVVTEPAAFGTIDAAPVVGLFADGHLDYEIDRAEQPSLAAMTRKALDLLSADPDGFFLMVEGSRIDHAAHNNDAVGHVHDVLAFDAALRVALDFAASDGQTLVVSAADHETGGLSLGSAGIYAWYPGRLRRATASADGLRLRLEAGADPDAALREAAGVDSLSAEERAVFAEGTPGTLALGRLVSRRLRLGWTTNGHTGVDVGLYAFGPGAEALRGVWENDALGRYLADALGLDLGAETERLRTAQPGGGPR